MPFAGVAVHGVGQRPEQVAPGHHFADLRLHAAELQGAGALQGLVEGAGDEVELDRQAGAALHREQPAEAALGEPLLAALEVAVDQYVLPGDEHLVHHQDRVVLVETAGQRVVERRSGDTRHQFVGGAADQLHAGGVHRRDEHQGEVGVVAEQLRRTLADEVVVGQRGIRGDHLGAADDDAAVDFLVHRDEHVLDLVHRLVVRGAAHPAVGQPRPLGDGVALLAQFVGAARVAEELVGIAAVAGIGLPAELFLALRIVQGVVEPGHGGGRVAEGGVAGDVLDAVAVDVDLTVVAQAGEVLLAGERTGGRGTEIFGFHHRLQSLLLSARERLEGMMGRGRSELNGFSGE